MLSTTAESSVDELISAEGKSLLFRLDNSIFLLTQYSLVCIFTYSLALLFSLLAFTKYMVGYIISYKNITLIDGYFLKFYLSLL